MKVYFDFKMRLLIKRPETGSRVPVIRIERPPWKVRLGLRLFVLISTGLFSVNHSSAAQSIARVWDEEILSAIRIDLPILPVHARNLFHVSVAMYDAWAAYDPVSSGYVYKQKERAGDISAARREAISYAAYRILKERYARSKAAATTLPALDAQMKALGYDTNNISTNGPSPSAVGN